MILEEGERMKKLFAVTLIVMYIVAMPIMAKNNVTSASSINQPIPDSYRMKIPVIRQMPELPRGCEVTSLAMVLHSKGIRVDKMDLARKVKKNPEIYQVKGGKVYFGDPNEGFVGDMYTYKNPGLGVYHKPIHELATSYVGDLAVDLTGQPFKEVLREVAKGNPVWVIQNSRFNTLPPQQWVTWHTSNGAIRVTYQEHSVVITGYDSKYIYVNDPLTGEQNRRLLRSSFIKGWKQMGSQAITIHNGNKEVFHFWQSSN